jgi:hypothetical protein
MLNKKQWIKLNSTKISKKCTQYPVFKSNKPDNCQLSPIQITTSKVIMMDMYKYTLMELVRTMERTMLKLELESGLAKIMLCEFQCCKILKSFIYSFYFALRNVSEPARGPATNNVAEIEAATRAVQVAKQCGNFS